jgi:hypothetical protein
MHGLIFVTWEKFLAERFGNTLIEAYRTALGETPATSPLASRVYDDETLLLGVQVACQLTGISATLLLREYGRYFILNGLTSHLCAYLLTPVRSAGELLLAMRDAHTQMRRCPDGLTPPVFGFEALLGKHNTFVLIYDSPRQLCPVLFGAIEGAGERYGEVTHMIERTCMKRGARVCRFEVSFLPSPHHVLQQQESPEMQKRRRMRRQLANQVLMALPVKDGMTLFELQEVLRRVHAQLTHLRPSVLLEALHHLQHAGLAASSANLSGEDLMHRRYWRAPTG